MRLATICHLYRVRLRARLVQELLAVAGIAVGVALLFASQVADTSLSSSVSHLMSGLVGKSRLQVTARDPHGFSDGLLAEVRSLPGVLTAVPVLERSVNLVGPRGSASVDLVGINATFASLEGQLLKKISGAQLPRQEGIGLPAPVARQIGAGSLQPLLLQIGARSERTVAALILQSSEIGELAGNPLALASLGVGQQLTGMTDRINRIVIEPRSGEDGEVRRELLALVGAHLNVTPSGFDAVIFEQAEGPTSQSTALFAAISALVGFMFAFNAMLLTVPQRRKLIGDLRLDGYPPVEIAEVMLFDALVLGVTGVAVGLLLGDRLARGLLQANPGYLSFAFPVGSVRVVSWQSIALACGGGLLAAVAGIMIPLRNDIFVRQGPGVRIAARTSHVGISWPVLGAVGCLAVTGAILAGGIAEVGVAVIALTSLILAMLLLLPTAFRLMVRMFDVTQRSVMGVSPRIAVIELQANSTLARSLAIAATGAIAVFGSVAIDGARHNLERGLGRVARQTTHIADIWVSPRGTSNTLDTTAFNGGLTPRLRQLPGVKRVSVYRGGFLDVGDRRTLVIAPPRDARQPVPSTQVVKGNAVWAGQLVRAGGWATLSQSLVDRMHLHIGQRFSLPTPNPFVFRLAAVITNFGWPPGTVIVNAEDFSRAWGTTQPNAYLVDLGTGASAARVVREIDFALGPRSALMVQTSNQREQAYRSTQRQGLSRLNAIAALVLIAAVLAMATTMGAMIWQRRSRIASMKVDGFDQGELWRSLLCESTVLLGSGCSLGAAFGLLGQVVLTSALTNATGFPVVFAVDGTIAIAVFASVTATAVAIVALPGYFATRVKPELQD
jgi:putative ABC transport system permease protein